jgi:hypothetical protein
MSAAVESSTDFYQRLASRREDSPELQACVRATVDQLERHGAMTTARPGMLLGKVQSGKTRAFLGIIALAFDQGFEIAVVLTKGRSR